MSPHIHGATLDTSTSGALIIDARALLAAIIREHGLDPQNTEHQHDALTELHTIIDKLDPAPLLLWTENTTT